MLEPWGLILIVIAVLILFGPKRLPDLGKSFRRSMKAFKEEIQEPPADKPADESASEQAPTEPESSRTDG